MRFSIETQDGGGDLRVLAYQWEGVPREMEPGCPVKWVTLAEFLSVSPFRDFYAELLPRHAKRLGLR